MAGTRLCKLSLQPVFVTLPWSTTIAHAFLELAEEDCFGHEYVFHPCDMVSPAQLHLKQDWLYAGQAGSLEDFFVRHGVLSFDTKDGVKATLVKPLQQPDLLPIENPGLCSVQEGGNDDGSVCLDLCGEAERVTAILSLTVFQRNCWLWTSGCKDPCRLWQHWT